VDVHADVIGLVGACYVGGDYVGWSASVRVRV